MQPLHPGGPYYPRVTATTMTGAIDADDCGTSKRS